MSEVQADAAIKIFYLLPRYLFVSGLLMLGLLSFTISECYSQSDHDHDHGHEPEVEPVDPLIATLAKKRSEKSAKPPSYNKFRPNFVEVCDLLELDHRRAVFDVILEALIVRNEQCVACKPFFQAFASNCREKKSKQDKKKSKKIITEDTQDEEPEINENEGEENPVRKPEIALDPHIFVIDAMSRLGIALESDQEQRANTLVAIDLLGNALSSKVEGYIDREYLLTAFTYLTAAFDDYRVQQEQKREVPKNAESELPSSETLNSLF